MRNQSYRQGDILLQKIEEIPETAEIKEVGTVVLAVGETTGHKHQIQQATLLVENTMSYLQLDQPSQLTHEEHETIEVPAGKYLVLRQREYSPSAPRTISD